MSPTGWWALAVQYGMPVNTAAYFPKKEVNFGDRSHKTATQTHLALQGKKGLGWLQALGINLQQQPPETAHWSHLGSPSLGF